MFATTRQPPNPKVFPPTPPPETEQLFVEQTSAQQIDKLSLSPSAGQNAQDLWDGAPKQRPILCPYLLKNPHLLPESSICRLRDFENVEDLKNHIEQDHEFPLRPRLNGDTELERFRDIWTQIFQSNHGEIPNTYLCDREFLRKQQNLGEIEMLEKYINRQLRDQPAVAALIQSQFHPKNSGHFFLPEPIPSMPDSGGTSPESSKAGLDDGNDLETQSKALPVSVRKKPSSDIESSDSCSPISSYGQPNRGTPDSPISLLLSIKERKMNQAIRYMLSIAAESLWKLPEGCSDADTEYLTSLSVWGESTDAGEQSSSRSSSSGQSDISQSTNTVPTTLGSSSGKRSASRLGPNGGDGDGGGKRRRPAPMKDNWAIPPSKRLSCPYFKKNPGRLRSNHSCAKSPGFENAHRVKEHVYRAHRRGPECPRCFEELETPEQLSNHLRDGLCDSLGKEYRPERESINDEQVEKLKKSFKGLTEEDKWRKMYRIIFNLDEDAETPSPYFEPLEQDMVKFRAYCGKWLPNLVRMKLGHRLEASLLNMLTISMQHCQEGLFTSFIEAKKSGLLENNENGEDSDAARAFDWNSFQLPSDPLWFTPDYGQPFSGFDPSADDPLLQHGISKPKSPISAGHRPQRSMLCPYFLKHPHLVPEHSPCRLDSFEDVHLLREHVAHDHKLSLQPELVGDTELEQFQHIWMQMFPNHQGNIPNPHLCDREFFRKQQNFRVIELHESYILAKLEGQPGISAILGKIFDDFRETFKPKNIGHYFLPDTTPAMPNIKLEPGVETSDDTGTHFKTKPKIDDELKDTATIASSEGNGGHSQAPAKSDFVQSSSDPIRSFLDSIGAEVVDKVMEHEFGIFAEEEDWDSLQDDQTSVGGLEIDATDTGEGTTQASSGSSQLDLSQSTGASSATGKDGKRKFADSGSNDDNGRGGKRQRTTLPEGSGPASKPKPLACPYFKRDPERDRDNHSCSKPPGFRNVSRVKEHLYRVHAPRNACSRCHEAFESPEMVQEHLASDERCEKVPRENQPEQESMTHEKEKMLRSKKDSRGPPEKQWEKVYHIVFPEDDKIPSPYYEKTPELKKYDSFCRQRLPQLVREELEAEAYSFLSETMMPVVQRCLGRLYPLFLEERAAGALDDGATEESNEITQTEEDGITERLQELAHESSTNLLEQISGASEDEEMGEMATPTQGQGSTSTAFQPLHNEITGNLPTQWFNEQGFLQDSGFEVQTMGASQPPFEADMDSLYTDNPGTFPEFPFQGD